MTSLLTTKFKALTIGLAALVAAPAIMMGAASTTEASAPAAVGASAPDFTLMDLDGKAHTLSEYTKEGNVVVLEWYSPTCPFVRKHYRDDTGTMTKMESDLQGKNVVWLRINSAHAEHPSADMKLNKDTAADWNITSPILMDPTGKVGKSYGAKRTPEMYIITSDQTLVYHGAIDNRSDAAAPGDDNYVSNALEEVLAGESVTKSKSKAYGCSVKYN
ncbi:MAG: redoxin domain-containing protein [Phycisphaerales bacterium]